MATCLLEITNNVYLNTGSTKRYERPFTNHNWFTSIYFFHRSAKKGEVGLEPYQWPCPTAVFTCLCLYFEQPILT